jgi:hypothetical protein
MEMMDIRAAIRWLDESSDLMIVMRKNLESHPKDESDVLKRELIVAQRAFVATALNASLVAAIAISDQMILEQPLLMEYAEDFSTLKKAQARYGAESNETCSFLKKSATVSETASVAEESVHQST